MKNVSFKVVRSKSPVESLAAWIEDRVGGKFTSPPHAEIKKDESDDARGEIDDAETMLEHEKITDQPKQKVQKLHRS